MSFIELRGLVLSYCYGGGSILGLIYCDAASTFFSGSTGGFSFFFFILVLKWPSSSTVVFQRVAASVIPYFALLVI